MGKVFSIFSIRMRAISCDMLKIFILGTSFKITNLRLKPYFPVASMLKTKITKIKSKVHHAQWASMPDWTELLQKVVRHVYERGSKWGKHWFCWMSRDETHSRRPCHWRYFDRISKFNENFQCSGLKCTVPITTKFCTHHDSVTVVMCAKLRCDQLIIFLTRALKILIKFRIRLKYR